jgi:branched-chain amino acid transport system permease protein
MRATAQDQDGARLFGINVDRRISFTFALRGAAAGAAAVLSVQTLGTTRYDQGFQFGLIAFTGARCSAASATWWVRWGRRRAPGGGKDVR